MAASTVVSTPSIFKKCSFIDDYGSCFCDDCDSYSWYYVKNGVYKLAPRPDGRCYCGYMRENCPNFQAYGKDCQGFKSTKG